MYSPVRQVSQSPHSYRHDDNICTSRSRHEHVMQSIQTFHHQYTNFITNRWGHFATRSLFTQITALGLFCVWSTDENNLTSSTKSDAQSPGSNVTVNDTPGVVGETGKDSTTARNITAGFKKAGIFPFNRELFTRLGFCWSCGRQVVDFSQLIQHQVCMFQSGSSHLE